MQTETGITQYFGANLALLLSKKILVVHPDFDRNGYIKIIKKLSPNLRYTERIALHADTLHEFLPKEYPRALSILTSILGPENPNETGMFTHYYWILPIGKFVETYGLDNFDLSMKALEEITKRNTGEYAIRPYLRRYPKKTLAVMRRWSKAKNFHLRRLASEGCRPKLPWATKLETFIIDPSPIFSILKNLMEDEIKFVQKSVANNLTDYLKVNKPAATKFIEQYTQSENKHTQWIIKHATRKIT